MDKVRFTTLAGVLAYAAACAPSTSSVSVEEDVANITRSTHEWVAAFEAEDVSRMMGFVAQGAVLIPPNQPIVSGAEAIEAWSQGLFENVDVEEASTVVEEVRVAGDWAVSHGTWHLALLVNGVAAVDTTRYTLVWEREPDGSWKVTHDIWNSALPLAGIQ